MNREQQLLTIGFDKLTIDNLLQASQKRISVRLCKSAEFESKIKNGVNLLNQTLEKYGNIYGVTTGVGDSCTVAVSNEKSGDISVNITRMHGCGLGDYFNDETVRALMIIRLNTLAYGFSGVSMELLQYIEFFIEHDILPLVPQEGSVGASGDLTPLSYIAGSLIGERNVRYKGNVKNSAEVLAEFGKQPYQLRPKEAMAVMNGTAVMNAIAALAFSDAEYLADLTCRITAMNSVALKGNAFHFNKRLFELKPHPGQALAAEKIRTALRGGTAGGTAMEKTGKPDTQSRLQDVYSIRCAPHVIGLFYDMHDSLKVLIETEMNSANDNPLVDPETQSIYHGGHFYGGHICFAMDSLKNIIANLADLMDRQFALLVDTKFSNGLPSNLSGMENDPSHHGFKALQVGVSAWTAEALKNTMPASVFSRSTECHNQDKVSMGTIAALDCVKIIRLVTQVAAASLLASFQALYIRLKKGELKSEDLGQVKTTYDEIAGFFAPIEADRQMEGDLRRTMELIKGRYFNLD